MKSEIQRNYEAIADNEVLFMEFAGEELFSFVIFKLKKSLVFPISSCQIVVTQCLSNAFLKLPFASPIAVMRKMEENRWALTH